MKQIINITFICLLLACTTFSCKNSSSNKESSNTSITSDISSYKIDISEGKTETEKTLLVKFNNSVETILAIWKKTEKGEEITPDEYFECRRLIDNFSSFLSDNQYNVSKSLVHLITKKNEAIEKLTSEKEREIQQEIRVDLNDYFNSSTGWDDDTDWNYAGLEDEESQKAFDKVLKKNGIYWSDQKQCWVKKVKKTAEQAPKVRF